MFSSCCVALLLVLAFGASGCSDPSPTRLCLEGDLGRFSRVSVEPLAGGQGACRALYRDPDGAQAQVEVGPYLAGAFDEAGVPVTFEKYVVFSKAKAGQLKLSWFTHSLAVHLRLPGAKKPAGPVLRAYLLHYPSQVVDAVDAVKRDVELLRQTSRQAPGDASVHLKLARKYRKLGNTVMATHEYHFAAEKDPACHPCFLEMGGLYKELRHWDLSIRALRKAAGLRPDEPAAWLQLGDVSYHVRNRLEAMRGYKYALRAGVDGEDKKRAAERLADLEAGKFLIQVLPGARKDPDDGD